MRYHEPHKRCRERRGEPPEGAGQVPKPQHESERYGGQQRYQSQRRDASRAKVSFARERLELLFGSRVSLFGVAQRALEIGNLGTGGGLHPGSLVKFWALFVLAMALLSSCKSVPEARVGVASIRFRGNDELASSELRTRIATQETPKFLGLFRASWRRYDDFEPE